MTNVSIVVLYYRAGAEKIHETISACQGSTERVAEIIVVDNNSGDGLSLELEDDRVRLVTLASNLGYAGGMNVGASHTSRESEYILFLTHEISLGSDAIRNMAADLDAGAILVAPKLILPNGNIWSRGGLIDLFGRPRHINGATMGRDPEWFDGAALMIRQSDFETLGGFDERYFLYWEDVDFGIRASRNGQLRCSNAWARQDTLGSPPYLMARGQIATWKKMGNKVKLLASIAYLPCSTALRVLRYRDSDSLKEILYVFAGVLDGLRGAWSVSNATWRPERARRVL